MPKICIDDKIYELKNFAYEEELESVVTKYSKLIFGENTVYFDIKKKVKSQKGEISSIPDGYLIVFFGKAPKLFIVENEISTHDELEIGQQLMRFQATFKEGQFETKSILMEETKNNIDLKKAIEKLIEETHFSNISELFDEIIFEKLPGFIVVIDEASERLREILRTLNSIPEIIEVKRYSFEDKTVFYFSNFEFEEVKETVSKKINIITDVDTIVCPAREEGFKQVFIDQNRWYAIRVSPSMISQIKYIAMYETKPFSGIRWVGIVKEIRPYKDTDKFEVILSDKMKLDNPLKLSDEENKKGIAPQGPRYTKMELIKKAKKLSDIF